jgi:copper chaperone CopZ
VSIKESEAMEKLVLTIPTLYGDHHTTAVRNILEKIKGVSDTYVSSAFHQVVVEFDPKKVKKGAIEKALSNEGYEPDDQELVSPASVGSVSDRSTRHTAAYTGVGESLSFSTKAPSWEGKPLWPCPGFDRTTMED